MTLQKLWLLISLVTWVLTVRAESIYRCTDANDKVTYSNHPCDKTAKYAKQIEVSNAAPTIAAPSEQAQGKSLQTLNEEFAARRIARRGKEAWENGETPWQKAKKEEDDRLAKETEENRQRELREQQLKREVAARYWATIQDAQTK